MEIAGLPTYGRPETVDIDIGLRQFMLRVYNFMLAGIGISGLVVYLAVATGFYQQIAGTPLIWIVVLAPPGAILFLSFSHREDQRRRTPGHVLEFCGILGPPHGVDRHRDAHPGEAKALAAYRTLARWDFPGLHGRQHRPGVLHERQCLLPRRAQMATPRVAICRSLAPFLSLSFAAVAGRDLSS